MSDKTYVKHVKTGEVFEVIDANYLNDDETYVEDKNYERRMFATSALIPYDPEEVWEDANMATSQSSKGYLEVHVPNRDWHPVPSPYTRTITRDGKLVVQRRKV